MKSNSVQTKNKKNTPHVQFVPERVSSMQKLLRVAEEEATRHFHHRIFILLRSVEHVAG